MAKFADEATIRVVAGKGGDGITAFRREKYVARGGPSGGNGGKGGDVVFQATHNANTLYEFRHEKRIVADSGDAGGPKKMTGADGEDAVVKLPVGTVVRDADTGEQIADLTESGQRVVVAEGGEGGRGNASFKSSTNRAPTKSTHGKPGEERHLQLELKLIADVGLVGFPSVGKSTLISRLSSAEPETAAYHFTTKTPNLGVVDWKDFASFVVADIPGLIEGASQGQGLGFQFLRHVERTELIAHVIEVTPSMDGQDDGRDPIEDFRTIRRELEKFFSDRADASLDDKPECVILNKIDLPYVKSEIDRLRQKFEDEWGLSFVAVSAATGENIDELKDLLGNAVSTGTFGDDTANWEGR